MILGLSSYPARVRLPIHVVCRGSEQVKSQATELGSEGMQTLSAVPYMGAMFLEFRHDIRCEGYEVSVNCGLANVRGQLKANANWLVNDIVLWLS